jgi:teichuronic acid biosynthesis glycosyltransferase TuaG
MNSNNELNPLVDIIIPNYNKGIFIDECINSVIRQSYKNWVLYIIDDASNDDSKKYLKKYENSKNINITYLKKNKGPHFCRNLALRRSTSEYIAFLDSDDYWFENKLTDQINFMIKNNSSFSFSDYFSFFNNDKSNLKSTNLRHEFNFEDFINNSSINSSTMILKRSIIGSTKFKNIKHEDYLFKCEILKKNVIANKINKKLANYRILKTSRSANKLNNLINLWYINKNYNHFNTYKNLKSLFSISINSLKKYGFKK